jgi:hypothetical protein
MYTEVLARVRLYPQSQHSSLVPDPEGLTVLSALATFFKQFLTVLAIHPLASEV